MIEKETLPVDEFQDLFDTRQRLEALSGMSDSPVKNAYEGIIESTNSRLSELAEDPEVRAFLIAVGRPALYGASLLQGIEDEDIGNEQEVRQFAAAISAEHEEIKKDPRIAMALEFLRDDEGRIDADPKEEGDWRSEKTASAKQLEFAQSIGLDIDPTAPRQKARNLISKEVKRLGQKELEEGRWGVGDRIDHQNHGKCMITNIHKRAGKVSIKPVSEAKAVVISGMSLKAYRD